jgi:hypothetical protein
MVTLAIETLAPLLRDDLTESERLSHETGGIHSANHSGQVLC